MYLPGHFTVTEIAQIAQFVDGAQAADLVTFDGTKPVSTLLPVIWDRPDDMKPVPAEFPEPGVPTGIPEVVLTGHDPGERSADIAVPRSR